MAAIEAEARRRGARAIRLNVMQSNPAAIALYRGAGWKELGRYPDEFRASGGYVDDIIMGKSLL